MFNLCHHHKPDAIDHHVRSFQTLTQPCELVRSATATASYNGFANLFAVRCFAASGEHCRFVIHHCIPRLSWAGGSAKRRVAKLDAASAASAPPSEKELCGEEEPHWRVWNYSRAAAAGGEVAPQARHACSPGGYSSRGPGEGSRADPAGACRGPQRADARRCLHRARGSSPDQGSAGACRGVLQRV